MITSTRYSNVGKFAQMLNTLSHTTLSWNMHNKRRAHTKCRNEKIQQQQQQPKKNKHNKRNTLYNKNKKNKCVCFIHLQKYHFDLSFNNAYNQTNTKHSHAHIYTQIYTNEFSTYKNK